MVESGTLATPGSLTISGASEVLSGATLDLGGGTLATDSLRIAGGATLLGPGTLSGDLINDGTLISNTGALILDGP